MRRGHFIRPNKEVSLPGHALFIDAEAEEKELEDSRIELKRTVAWSCYWRKAETDHTRNPQWRKIEDLDVWWDWVERLARPKNTLYIFAHNCYVDFSWLDGFRQLADRGWQPRIPYVYGLTFIASWTKAKRRILLLDTANYFQTSVDALGDMLGLEKLGEGGRPFPGVSWDEYCKRDVEIIMETMVRYWSFVSENNLGGFALTTPAQSMKAYRHRFMSSQVWIHTDAAMTRLERLSYHGGRTEAFYQGTLTQGPYYKLDFNSAYPSVMVNHLYPCGDYGYRDHCSLEDLEWYLQRKLVIARVQVETEEPVYPFESEGKLLFPVGSFETTLTTRELEYALSRNHIAEVYELAVYHGGELFKDYVGYFYDLRLQYRSEGNVPYDTICKLYLNSLYGKWAQRDIKRTILGECPIGEAYSEPYLDHDTGHMGSRFHYGGTVYAETKVGEAYNSFTAISAHIAADVRMALWRAMSKAGKGHYLYCDTDGLWVDSVGMERLWPDIHPELLGSLKVEDTAETVTIHAPKDYVFGNEVKHKGVSKGALEVSPGVFETVQWQGFRGAMRHGELGRVILTPMVKHLTRHVDKGVLQDDGTIVPYHFTDGELTSEIEKWDKEVLCQIEMALYEGIKKFPQTLVFTVWDYREGALRHGVDNLSTAPHFKGVPLDIIAGEFGYTDYNTFLADIEGQVEIDRRIKQHKRKERR